MQNIYRETFEQIHASEQLRKEVALSLIHI